MNMAREWLEANREMTFSGHDEVVRFGAFTLTRREGRLWLWLELTPVMTADDTNDGRGRMISKLGVLARDLSDVMLELEEM